MGETMPEYVWVFVGVYAGVEESTEVFRSEASAEARYRKFAEEHDIPMDEDGEDFDWSESEYTAWTSRVEVLP
jgi:hypothetical protein